MATARPRTLKARKRRASKPTAEQIIKLAGDPPSDDPPKTLAEFRQWLVDWINWWHSEAVRNTLANHNLLETGPAMPSYAKSVRAVIRVASALNIASTDYPTLADVKDEEVTRKQLLKVYSDLVKRSDAMLTVRTPLGEKAALLYEMLISLPEHRGMTGPKILDWFSDTHGEIVDQGTLTKEIIPALKPYGLRPAPRIGYFIPQKDRPKEIPS